MYLVYKVLKYLMEVKLSISVFYELYEPVVAKSIWTTAFRFTL